MRGLDPIGQRRIDGDAAVRRKFDEALRKIAIVGGKRRTDLTFGDFLIEAAIKRPIGDCGGVVGDGCVVRLDDGRNREGCGQGERCGSRKSQQRMLCCPKEFSLAVPRVPSHRFGVRCPETKLKFVAFWQRG